MGLRPVNARIGGLTREPHHEQVSAGSISFSSLHSPSPSSPSSSDLDSQVRYIFTLLYLYYTYKHITHDIYIKLLIHRSWQSAFFLAYQLMSHLNLFAFFFEEFDNDYTLTTILDLFNSHCLSFCFLVLFIKVKNKNSIVVG